ncbi:MAG: peptidylprolyl isomerase, partial [Candidatus Cloacimonetes bacterium]|nr:peptidylprolyl isomerase [Candidatus Cloacimonadota bacterium]
SILIMFSIISGEVLDKIVAKVGREIILRSDLEKRIQQMTATGYYTEEISNYDILNDMIESKLIIQKAKEEDYKIDEFDVKSLAENQIEEISSQFSSEDEFKEVLMDEMGLTVLELKEFYIHMITEQRLKEQIIRNNIKNKIHITEAEVENYFQENKEQIPLRSAMDQIGKIKRVIKPSKATKEKALIEINKIMDRLNEGEDFIEIANSVDKYGEKFSGGDLGFFGKGKMVKPFEDAAFALRPGEISEVVETKFGFHIIKMEERLDDEIRVSHILRQIQPTELDIEATIQLMENILERLNNNEDFSELARKYSEDDSTAVNGGIVGEFPTNSYPKLFKEYLNDLDYGQYSQLVKEGDDLYIFGKLKQIAERPYSYEEIYENLRKMVISEKEIELYDIWTKELIKETYVEIFLKE